MALSQEDKDNITKSVTSAVLAATKQNNGGTPPVGGGFNGASVKDPTADEIKRFKMGLKVHALAMAKQNNMAVQNYVDTNFSDWQKGIFYHKAPASMNSGEFNYGGSLVRGDMAEDIIPALTAAAVVRGSNPVTVPMPSGVYTKSKITQGSTANYTGETQTASTSRMQTGQITLTAKKLVTLVPMSNSLLRRADPRSFEMLSQQMFRDAAAREDLAFIRGDGTANTPKGFRNLALTANVLTMTGSVTATTVQTDISLMITAIYAKNVMPVRPTWIMSMRVREYLANLKDNGQKVYPSIDETNTLKGHPIRVSNQIPNNLGGGTESEVYLVDMGYVLLGDTEDYSLEMFDGATYTDGSNTFNGVQTDESLVRLVGEHDIGTEYDEAIAVLTGVTWGA